MIPLFKPSTDEREIEALRRVLRSGWLGLGPETAAFEAEFAAYTGCAHAVAVNSCTAAMILALRAYGIDMGDEVIVPTMTFCSTAHAVVAVGAKPVFADVDASTLCMSREGVERVVTGNTKAVLPVHFAGYVVTHDWACLPPGIPHIEDCAHAAGAALHGKRVGSEHMGCFSFHAVKNLTCGDGGMITTNSQSLADRARRLRWLGIDKTTHDRTDTQRYSWEYGIEEYGYKCHMHDIAAAMARVQLSKLDEMNYRRGEIACRYSHALQGVGIPPIGMGLHSWHLYVIRHPERDRLREHLQARGVTTGVHYKPLHTYQLYGLHQSCPVADQAFREILSLPMYPDMTEAEHDIVTNAVNEFNGGADV